MTYLHPYLRHAERGAEPDEDFVQVALQLAETVADLTPGTWKAGMSPPACISLWHSVPC